MTQVFLDPGHGAHDSGAQGNGLQEKNAVLNIAKAIRNKLMAYDNVEVRLSREYDTYLGLSERANMANNWGADIFISIHQNAANGRANGYEDYIHSSIGPSSATSRYQSIIHDSVYNSIRALGNTPDRGTKSANFAVLRETTMPAVLTENLFIDSNGVDGRIITGNNFIDTVAQGHVNGIANIFNLGEPPIIGGGDEMLNPSNHALNKAVQQILAAWDQDDNQPLSAEWREAFERRELSVSDAVALLYIGVQRGYINR